MEIRLLTPKDVEDYRSLRLRALREEPEAFGISYEEYKLKPIDQIRQGLEPTEKQLTLGAFDDQGHLIGMVGWTRKSAMKMRHKSEIWGVYVVPEHRGKVIARTLLRQLIQKVREQSDVEQIQLAVHSDSVAHSLYRSIGFQMYGVERNALKIGNRYVDEKLMVFFLK